MSDDPGAAAPTTDPEIPAETEKVTDDDADAEKAAENAAGAEKAVEPERPAGDRAPSERRRANLPPRREDEDDDGPKKNDDGLGGSSLLDNAHLGLALRYTLRPARLVRVGVVLQGMLILSVLAVSRVYQDDSMATIAEIVPVGRALYAAIGAMLLVFLSVYAPISVIGTFWNERRDQCFDQVVATGISPLTILWGRFVATMAGALFLLAMALPFLVLPVASGVVPVGDLVGLLVILVVFIAAVTIVALANSVSYDDASLMVLGALVLLGMHGLALTPLPTSVTALSPMRVLMTPITDALTSGGMWGYQSYGTLFGFEIPAGVLCVFYWVLIGGFGLLRWCVGTDHILEGGVSSFDAVAIGKKASPRAARAPLTKALLRSVQMAFLYENLPRSLRRLEPFNHELFRTGSALVAIVLVFGALWLNGSTTFGSVDDEFLWPSLVLSTFILFGFVGYGVTARTAARDPRPFVRLVRPILRLIGFVLVVALPFLLLFLYAAVELNDLSELHPGETLGYWSLISVYAGCALALVTLSAYLVKIRFIAGLLGMAAFFGLCVGPLLMMIPFARGVGGEGLLTAVDASPFFAIVAVVDPRETFNFPQRTGEMWTYVDHRPSPWPSAILFGFAGVVAGGLALLVRMTQLVLDLRKPAPERPAAGVAPSPRPAVATGALLLAVALAIGGGLVSAEPAAAQGPPRGDEGRKPDEVRIDGVIGFAGHAGIDGWFPTRVQIENRGAARSVQLRLEDGDGELLRERSVELPARGTAHVSFTLPAGVLDDGMLQVKVLVDGDVVEKELGFVSNHQRIVGAVDDRGVQLLGSIDLPPERFNETSFAFGGFAFQQDTGVATRVDTPLAFPPVETLPTDTLAYTSLAALVWGHADPASIKAGSLAAIRGWVRRGGHLVICAGPHAGRIDSPLFEELFGAGADLTPGDAETVAARDLPRLRALVAAGKPRSEAGSIAAPGTPFTVTVLTPDAGDEVLLVDSVAAAGGARTLPIAVRRRAGLGAVTVLAACPLEAPLMGTPLSAGLLEVGVLGGPSYVGHGRAVYGSLAAVRSETTFLQPVLGFLAFYLATFILVALALKRAGRELHVWRWLPVLGVVFAFSTPVVSILSSRQSTIGTVTIVESDGRSETARATSGAVVFSGASRDLQLEVRGEDPIAYSLRLDQSGPRGHRAYTERQPDGRLQVGPLAVPLWGSRTIVSETLRKTEIKARITVGPRGGTITIENGLGRDLEHCVLTFARSPLPPEGTPVSGFDASGAPVQDPNVGYGGMGSAILQTIRIPLIAAGETSDRNLGPADGTFFGAVPRFGPDRDVADAALEQLWGSRVMARVDALGEAWLLGRVGGPPTRTEILAPDGVVRRLDTEVFAVRVPVVWQGYVPFRTMRRDVERMERPATRRGEGQTERRFDVSTSLTLPPIAAPDGREGLAALEGARLVLRGFTQAQRRRVDLEVENVETGAWEKVSLTAAGQVYDNGQQWVQVGNAWFPMMADMAGGFRHIAVLEPAARYVRGPEGVIRFRESVVVDLEVWAGGEPELRIDVAVEWGVR